VNINATLLGQAIAFAMFVWFCMKYVWPPIIAALEERKSIIAEGLAAAERGAHEKELAEKQAVITLKDAKHQASDILSQAQKRSNEIVEDAKNIAKDEGDKIRLAARAEIDMEINQAKEKLRQEITVIALAGAEKILGKEIDGNTHQEVLNQLAKQI
jgi:F-type H+-transporting ATPase subunit b